MTNNTQNRDDLKDQQYPASTPRNDQQNARNVNNLQNDVKTPQYNAHNKGLSWNEANNNGVVSMKIDGVNYSVTPTTKAGKEGFDVAKEGSFIKRFETNIEDAKRFAESQAA